MNFKYLLSVLTLCMLAVAGVAQSKLPNYVLFTSAPTHNEYKLGEKAVIRIMATEAGRNVDGVEVSFEAGQDNLSPDTTGTARFVDGMCLVDIGTMNKPGFRRCKFKFFVNNQSYTDQVTVGFATADIRPTVTEPKDFDAFWKKTLREAAKVPMDITLTDDPAHTNDSVESKMIRFQNYKKGIYIYGYLTRPRDGKKHPVMLRVPGAGVKKVEFERSYSKEGYIVLSIGVNGIPADATDSVINQFKKEIGDYWVKGLDSRENYYYRRIYCALVRGIDILTSQPDWNGQDVAVYGGSQGGALSMVAAGLDPRVTMVTACYPALCDIGGYMRGTTGGWPNIGKSGKVNVDVPTETWLNTVSYYDVSLFARRIKAPGCYIFGYNDGTCSPTSTRGAINSVPAEKTIITTPYSGHWRYPEVAQQAIEWARELLKKEKVKE